MTTYIANRAEDIDSLDADASIEPRGWLGLTQTAWVKIGVISGLFCLLFWPNLVRLWGKTNPISGEENWKHAIFVPLAGLYYLYVNREQLTLAKPRTTWAGLGIMLIGVLTFAWAIWPLQNDWFKDLGMVITLFGVVAFLCGWEVMKTAWFPIIFLICALPWPGLFYSTLAGPLQELAAKVAVRIMGFIGVQSGQFGTKIFVEGRDPITHLAMVRTLNVEEACSGLRSLMTFISIAAAVAFLSYRPLWQKLVMVSSAIPIAIFCNTMRVTMQGVLARYASPQWAEGAAHGFVGLVMMIPAFFLILLVGWVLQNIMIDEVSDKAALREGALIKRRQNSGGGEAASKLSRTATATAPSAPAATPAPTAAAIAAARASAQRVAPAKAATNPATAAASPAKGQAANVTAPQSTAAARPAAKPIAPSTVAGQVAQNPAAGPVRRPPAANPAAAARPAGAPTSPAAAAKPVAPTTKPASLPPRPAATAPRPVGTANSGGSNPGVVNPATKAPSAATPNRVNPANPAAAPKPAPAPRPSEGNKP